MNRSAIGRLLRGVRAGQQNSVWSAPGLRAPETVRIWSSAFGDGQPIPSAHAGRGVGGNEAPPLYWEGLPEGTAQLLFVLEDTDVPLPRPLLHTVALIDPAITGFGQGELRPGAEGVHFVPASFGRVGYAGPRPIPGHGAHHYGLQLYALDRRLGTDAERRARSLLATASGHVLARGRLIGTYTIDR